MLTAWKWPKEIFQNSWKLNIHNFNGLPSGNHTWFAGQSAICRHLKSSYSSVSRCLWLPDFLAVLSLVSQPAGAAGAGNFTVCATWQRGSWICWANAGNIHLCIIYIYTGYIYSSIYKYTIYILYILLYILYIYYIYIYTIYTIYTIYILYIYTHYI